MLLSWFSLGYAGVEVSDAEGCIDADRVDNELRLQLGDAVVDGLQITIEAVPLTAGDSRDLQIRTTVDERGTTLWTRSAEFSEADCPAVPEAIALSVQQGLAQLPGWSFDSGRQGVWLEPTLDLVASAGLPFDGRFGAQVGARIRGSGPLALWTQVRIQTGPPFEVGDGAASIVHPALAVGPVLRSNAALRPEIWWLASGGPLFAFGSRFDTDRAAVLPRVATEIGAGFHPGGPVRVGLFTEIPVVRIRLVQADGAGRTEAPVRVGLTLGLDFSRPE